MEALVVTVVIVAVEAIEDVEAIVPVQHPTLKIEKVIVVGMKQSWMFVTGYKEDKNKEIKKIKI